MIPVRTDAPQFSETFSVDGLRFKMGTGAFRHDDVSRALRDSWWSDHHEMVARKAAAGFLRSTFEDRGEDFFGQLRVVGGSSLQFVHGMLFPCGLRGLKACITWVLISLTNSFYIL